MCSEKVVDGVACHSLHAISILDGWEVGVVDIHEREDEDLLYGCMRYNCSTLILAFETRRVEISSCCHE